MKKPAEPKSYPKPELTLISKRPEGALPPTNSTASAVGRISAVPVLNSGNLLVTPERSMPVMSMSIVPTRASETIR